MTQANVGDYVMVGRTTLECLEAIIVSDNGSTYSVLLNESAFGVGVRGKIIKLHKSFVKWVMCNNFCSAHCTKHNAC